MRVGSHPLKKTDKLAPPEDVTIQMVTFIPFMSGYFEQSLDVLKFSLQSIQHNTKLPYDLMVFDNGSCAEVRHFLLEQQAQKRIQYLFLSDENVGIPGAWNVLFSSAPGKIIAYSDSDIYFYPRWLEEHLRVLETYPNVGMVTGIPLRTPEQYSTRTLQWAETTPEAAVSQGYLQEWEIYWTHVRSLGITEKEARQKYQEGRDVKIKYRDVSAYVGAGHFQFVAYKEALNAVMPFPYITPMGNERYLDASINDNGFLRLSLPGMFVRHLGNRLTEDHQNGMSGQVDMEELIPADIDQIKTTGHGEGDIKSARLKWFYRFLDVPLVKRIFLSIYNRIFRLYYNRS